MQPDGDSEMDYDTKHRATKNGTPPEITAVIVLTDGAIAGEADRRITQEFEFEVY